MLINFTTQNGQLLVNTDNLTQMFCSSQEECLFVHEGTECVKYAMTKSLVDDAIKQIKEIGQNQETNID